MSQTLKHNIHILLIEDNEDDREFFARLCRKIPRQHIRLSEANNMASGLLALEDDTPDCIFLDYYLPDGHGIDMLEAIARIAPHVPVIMLSGQGSEALVADAMHQGAAHYLVKQDATPEKLLEKIEDAVERGLLKKRVAEQQEALTLFTRAMTHDLKEPLRMIESFAHLIEKKNGVNEECAHYFERICQAIGNMNELLDMVHHYSRLGHVDDAEGFERISLNEAVETALENLTQLVSDTSPNLQVDTLPDITGHKVLWALLFQNMLSNAIYYNDKDVADIKIGAEQTPKGMRIFVRDNGPGIPEEARKIIFDPFRRYNCERRGSGLGLAICKRIAEIHEANIEVRPCTPGTEFSITLPATLTDTVADSAPSEPFVEDAMEDEDVLAHILLVEDNKSDIELTRIYLQEADGVAFHLHTVLNGKEALAFLDDPQNPLIDLILLDINMPIMDGFTFLQQYNKRPSKDHVPVVINSTSDSQDDMRRASQLGADGYMCKPANWKKLGDFVTRMSNIRVVESANGIRLNRVQL